VLEQFNIRQTPALFLIDSNGKIMDKEVFGNALENRIKELLK